MASSTFVQHGAGVAVLDRDDSAANRTAFITPLLAPLIGRDHGSEAKHQRSSNQET
jgi:hypothetical protein